MEVKSDFELVSFSFATAELILRKKLFDDEGKYQQTLTLATQVPEFRDLTFFEGKMFQVTIEELS